MILKMKQAVDKYLVERKNGFTTLCGATFCMSVSILGYLLTYQADANQLKIILCVIAGISKFLSSYLQGKHPETANDNS